MIITYLKKGAIACGCALLSICSIAQISGVVIDANTQKPLPFAKISSLANNINVLCDINGVYTINDSLCTDFIMFEYTGYQSKTFIIKQIQSENVKIEMIPSITHSNNKKIKYTDNGEKIIKRVIENSKYNKPEMLSSYSYTAYEKLLFTYDFDTPNIIDSILESRTLIESLPQLLNLKQKSDDHDIFLLETVRNKSFRYPGNSKDEVISVKASGFKKPAFTFLSDQLQTYSIYDSHINIARKVFINPIGKDNCNKYDYTVEDILITENNDTIFIISFEPKKSKPISGLKGLLYINSIKYAVQYFIAEEFRPYNEPFEIKIIQQYKMHNREYWFPDKLFTYVTFNNVSTVKNFKMYNLKAVYKSYILEPKLNTETDKKEFSNIILEVNDKAHIGPEKLLQEYRISPLTDREIKTYEIIDSLGKKYYFDYGFRVFERSMLGYLPIGPVDLDLNRVLDYNNYEGVRIGIGATTNQLFSRFFEIDAYLAYGNMDNDLKYGSSIRFIFNKRKETALRFSYKYDIMESGGFSFFEKSTILSSQYYRHFFLNTFDHIEKRKISFESSFLKHFQTNIGLSQSYITTTSDYSYTINDINPVIRINEFQFTELEFQLRFAYNEKCTFTPNGSKFVYVTRYPIIHLNILNGVDYLDGNFKYVKIESQLFKKFHSGLFGYSQITVIGGKVFGDLPFCKLYNGQGSYSDFSLESENSFATMRPNEFLSDQFLIVYFRQDFGKFLPRNNFLNPNLVFSSNMQFGSLSNVEKHNNVDINTLEKGYFESGLLIENILKARIFGFGFGSYYRYGPYSYTTVKNNIALRLTLLINL